MRTTSLIFSCLSIILLLLNACKSEIEMKESKRFEPPVSFETATVWADSMVSQMTIEEKILMIGGDRIFYTHGIPRLGIPPILFADASQGVHLRSEFNDGHKGVVQSYEQALPKSTAFPAPILLASTWNKELAADYAKAIGEECRAGAIPVLLGPGMNIYRVSQCGRNFEYFGEDPFLAARMIENYVLGLQSTGTIATLKHFVANNSDYYRRKSNSIVDDRTLHEIYMPAFKAGIDAGAMAVMTAYNLVDGEWCGESEYVINNLLRDQLNFKWLVMTDWWSVYDAAKTVNSGQDLEMPYRWGTEDIVEELESGRIEEKNIDRMLVSFLRTLHAMNAFDREKDMAMLEKFEEHEKVALQTAREGIVLLQNNGILPLIDKSKKVLLTGEYVDRVAEGGGAATVDGYNHVVLEDALIEQYGSNLSVNKNASDDEISNAEKVILNIGTFDSEGWDRPFNLPAETEEQILRTSSLNSNTIVVVNSGSGINMTAWQEKVAAILYCWYPGQNGATAMAEIICGTVNPSGKLPISIERNFSDSPGADYLPEGEELYSGWNDHVENERNIHNVEYSEGVFVGYRWYEKQEIEPLFPFGHGLSYATFEYSNLKLAKKDFSRNEAIELRFNLLNSGNMEGLETAQLYIKDVKSSVDRPLKELKGFEKIQLAPGEEKEIKIVLDKSAFSYWSSELKEWTLEDGEFQILIGSSSEKILLKASIEIK